MLGFCCFFASAQLGILSKDQHQALLQAMNLRKF